MSLRIVMLICFGFVFFTSQSAGQTTAPPTIISLIPSSGAPGNTVQINGVNLGSQYPTVVFTGPNGTQISTIGQPFGALTVRVPYLAETGPVFLLIPNGQGGFNQTNALSFTRTPGLRIRAAKRDISAGESDNFRVAFFGATTPQVVQWSADLGSIDESGQYTAPGSVQTDQFAHVSGCLRGTSVCDSQMLGLHPFRVTPHAPVVQLGHNIALQATAADSPIYPLWANLSGVGTLEPDGEYEAPESPQQGGPVQISAQFQGHQQQTSVAVVGGFPGLVNRITDYVDFSFFGFQSHTQPTNVAFSDNRAYVFSRQLTNNFEPAVPYIDVYDIEDPVHPVWLASAESATDSFFGGNLYFYDGKLYSIGESGPFSGNLVMAAYDFRGELPVLSSRQLLPAGAPWTFAQGIVTVQEPSTNSTDSPAFVDQFFPAEPSGRSVRFQLPPPFSGNGYQISVVGATRDRLYAVVSQPQNCFQFSGNLVTYDLTANPASILSLVPFQTNQCSSSFARLVVDKYAVFGQEVFDISVVPPQPMSGLPKDVTIVDAKDHLLVGTTYQNGIRVFETDGSSSVKETESLVDRISVLGGICLNKKHVYAAEGDAGLAIYDVSQPGGILTKSQLEGVFGTAYAQLSADKYLFSAGGSAFGGSLAIFDLTQDPPAQLASVLTGKAIGNDLALIGTNLYLGTTQNGLLFDVSTPTAPSLVATFNVAVNSLYAVGKILYVGTSNGPLYVVDTSTPASPVLLTTFSLPDKAIQITSSGNRLLIADRTGGLLVFDISNPAAPVFQSQLKVGRGVMGVQGDGNLALLAALEQGLVIVDVTMPLQPKIISSLAFDSEDPFRFGPFLQGQASTIVLRDKIAFVGTFINPFDPSVSETTGNMLCGVDYSLPQYPRLVSLSAFGGIVSMALAGDDLLVSFEFSSGQQRLNVSQPRNSINLFYPPASLRTPVTKLPPLPAAQSYTKF